MREIWRDESLCNDYETRMKEFLLLGDETQGRNERFPGCQTVTCKVGGWRLCGCG